MTHLQSSYNNLKVLFMTLTVWLVLIGSCVCTDLVESEKENEYYATYRDQFDEDEDLARLRIHDDPDQFMKKNFIEDEHYSNYDDDDDDNDDNEDNEDTEELAYEKKQSSEGHSDVCMSRECIMASASILSTMNETADPCDDFYNYVCGKFPLTHEPFPDMTRTMSFETKRRKNAFTMHKVMQKMSYDNELKSFDKLKAAYDSCMDESRMDKYGIGDINKLVGKYGPWPLRGSSWNNKTWNLKKSLNTVIVNLPVTAFFSLQVSIDPKNVNEYALTVSQHGLFLPREYYISSKNHEKQVRKAYFDMMLKVLKLFGYKSTNLAASMKKVLNFEIELAKIYLPTSLLRKTDVIYKKKTLRGLELLNPEIGWKDLINQWLKLVKFNHYRPKKIIVMGEKYFKDLAKLIINTDKETLANYIMWRIVNGLKSFAGKKIKDVELVFKKLLYGQKSFSPNWRTCIRTLQAWMPFAYGRLYVDHEFKSKYAKKEVSNMINRIQHAFIDNLKNVEWMDEKTKKRAKSKALAIIKLVGYPSYILDNEKLDKQYSEVSMTKGDFLGNFLNIYKFSLKRMIRRLKKKRDRTEWLSNPAAVNAFYSPKFNRILIPAGISGPFFYHHQYPPSLKYGGIGTVIGHELTHAFDDQGRKYDKTGRLVQWWETLVIKNFKKIADCIRNQYSSYKIYGRNMNGNLSCGENLADNGGVKLAYRAYKAYIEEHPHEKTLPGLEHLNHDQLFYVAFAKIWCVIERKAAVIKRIFTDPHSYPKFRVQGPLSNSEDFARAFKCKVGSQMNPSKKCKFW